MRSCKGWLQREVVVRFFVAGALSEGHGLSWLLPRGPGPVPLAGQGAVGFFARGSAQTGRRRELGGALSTARGREFVRVSRLFVRTSLCLWICVKKGASIRSGGFLAPPAFTSCNSSGLKKGGHCNPSFVFWQPFCWKHRWACLDSFYSSH